MNLLIRNNLFLDATEAEGVLQLVEVVQDKGSAVGVLVVVVAGDHDPESVAVWLLLQHQAAARPCAGGELRVLAVELPAVLLQLPCIQGNGMALAQPQVVYASLSRLGMVAHLLSRHLLNLEGEGVEPATVVEPVAAHKFVAVYHISIVGR